MDEFEARPDPDLDRVFHMLQAVRAALEFTAGRTKEDVTNDLMLQFARLRAFEIIGEAAARTTEVFRDAHAEIPWRAMIGLRNRLIHGYFEVDLEIVWSTTKTSLPTFIASSNHSTIDLYRGARSDRT